MPAFDNEIDELYALPPAAFTDARNALAKRIGGVQGATVRALVKPQLAAWAVNQVYWRDRVAFDRLVKAAEAVRATHRRLVSGDSADVAGAEAAHADALARAQAVARDALGEAGQVTSPAVLAAITDTLRALPTSEPFGRLAKALTPTSGFDAFAGVAPRATSPRALAPLRLQKGAATGGRAVRDVAHERARVEKELTQATARLREATAALKALTRAIESAERDRDRRQAALDDAEARLHELAIQLPRTREAAEEASHEQERLRRRAQTLEPPGR